jgi:flagellar biogenesis protein FliO
MSCSPAAPALRQEKPVVPLPPDVAAAPLPEPLASSPAPAPPSPAASPVLIAETRPAAKPSPLLAERSEGGPSLGGFIASSVFVVALMLGGLLLLKRYGRRSRLLGGADAIKVLARRGLGQRQEVLLIEAGPRVFLVGSTRDQLSTLGEYSDPDEVSALLSGLPGDTSRATFRQALREGLREEEAPAPAPVRAERTQSSVMDELAEIRRTVQAWRA